MRRAKVRRVKGIPDPYIRCYGRVETRGQLFSDRCKRVRAVGSAYCWQHQVGKTL